MYTHSIHIDNIVSPTSNGLILLILNQNYVYFEILDVYVPMKQGSLTKKKKKNIIIKRYGQLSEQSSFFTITY